MAKNKAVEPADTRSLGNQDDDAKKLFVDKLYEIEKAFEEAKAERTESVKDLMEEVKSRAAATGVSPADVKRLVKVRMDMTEAKDTRDELIVDIDTILELYPDEDEV